MNHKAFFAALLLLTSCFSVASAADTEGRFTFGTATNPDGRTIEVDRHGFIIDGHYALPVMGEIHYARVPRCEWRREIQKMRAGGITIIATYCFWIHHEAEEGRWDWSGNKDLHAFLLVCQEEKMPVVLRIGPFCHGEVYQGGFPVWLTEKASSDPKAFKLRSEAPGFIAATQRLYSNIFAQTSDMLWKHGGPVIGVQIENECRGPWSYYMRLRDMAIRIGFDVPFMTRTGWPKLNGKEEFGKLLPLYGDYADGFWDRSLTDMPGDYKNAFIMKDTRLSSVIATEALGNNQDTKMSKGDRQYPYLTCELGGGMMPSYHRRINMSGNEALPMAVCKLGSGSNLPGYYMYHGGTNPYCKEHTMGETQATSVTNYNDMPYMSYDFQCPLGEMGQPNLNAFHQTRLLHQFLADWGEELAVMDVDTLSQHYARRGCFEFYNDYVRIINEGGRSYVRPVKMLFEGHLISADAQPFCKIGKTIYFVPIKGMKPVITIDGKRFTAKADKARQVKDITVCLLSAEKALRAFKIDGVLHYAKTAGGILYKDGDRIVEESWETDALSKVSLTKTQEAGPLREVVLGSQKVAAMPHDADFSKAETWRIDLPEVSREELRNTFLAVTYSGDCARVYADGRLVMDNFWNGKTMLVRLSDLVGGCCQSGLPAAKSNIELRILPSTPGAPIYLDPNTKKALFSMPVPKAELIKRIEK